MEWDEAKERAEKANSLRDAHWINLEIRRNGKDEHHEGDWIKYLGGDFLAVLARIEELEGQPVIQSEWEALESALAQAREEIERLQEDKVLKIELIEAMEARIDAALALHVEIEGQCKAKVCRECSGYYSIAYPCPTVKALRGEKEEK